MPRKGNALWATLALEGIAWVARDCQLGMFSNKMSSPHRSLEPLDPEGPSPPVLSTFLPPVPSTSLDPPEHFPLRKTGKALGIMPSPSRHDILAACLQGTAGAEKWGGLAPQNQSSLTLISSGTGTNHLVCLQHLNPT